MAPCMPKKEHAQGDGEERGEQGRNHHPREVGHAGEQVVARPGLVADAA